MSSAAPLISGRITIGLTVNEPNITVSLTIFDTNGFDKFRELDSTFESVNPIEISTTIPRILAFEPDIVRYVPTVISSTDVDGSNRI